MADYVSKYTGEEIDEAVRLTLEGNSGSGTGLPTGGAANQMLVTDADGNALWEDRTHYAEVMNAEVIPETEWVNNEGQFMLAEAPTNQPVAGTSHTIVYNGVSFDCVGVLYEEDGMTAVGLGNTYAVGFGGEPSTVPFFALIFSPEAAAAMGAYGLCMALDGAESVTMSITINGEVAHPLDEKYIPDSVLPKNTNLVNGRASGSVRSVNAAEDVDGSTPLGKNAFAFGDGAIARGNGSIALGNQASVGMINHDGFNDDYESGVAIGKNVQTDTGIAIGTSAITRVGVAIGDAVETTSGVAIGSNTEASGESAVAVGYECIASGKKQVVLGCNNIEDTDGRYAFILGNGTKTVEDPETGYYWPRSNALTIDRDGNAWIAGDVYIGGTSQDDAKKLATVEDVEAAAGGSTAVPAYVRTEAETVARLVNQHQSNDSIIIPFLSDAHCGYYQDTANAATALAGQLLHLIGKRVPYDVIVNGGDMANGAWDTTRALSFDQIEDYTELTSDAHRGVPAIWVPGNHDDAPYMATADRVTQQEMFALIGRKNRQSGAICPNGCNYGYLDLESQHLRVIYLDTDDKRGWGTVQVGNGETAPAYLNAHNVGGDQLRWLAETALDFSGKDAADWSVVVVSHVALDVSGTYTDVVSGTSYANSTANAASVLSAYASGGSGSITHNGITVPYDYSALDARATVICCVHGHGHKFVNGMVSGILSIGCPNVMNGRERESSDGNTYTKTAGTAEGTSFCIMTIDRENRKVYADCVGVGPDREFEYTTEVMPYTNLLPISTDASGAVYNGKGYKENTYLSSGNDGTKSGIYASGYIQGVANEYGNYFFYLKNVGMQTGQDSHRVALYDGTKTYITTVKTTVTGNPFTYGDDGNIAQLMFTGTSYPDGLYIRICCAYLGDDSIITANEPIE